MEVEYAEYDPGFSQNVTNSFLGQTKSQIIEYGTIENLITSSFDQAVPI